MLAPYLHSRIHRFAWSDVNLWAEDLPERALIVISGQDDLIHVNEVSVRRGRSCLVASRSCLKVLIMPIRT